MLPSTTMTAETARPSRYRFGPFELQPQQRRLLRSGKPVDITRRAFDVIALLVQRSGQLVTKEELLEWVWPKLVVEEANLHVHVSSLRKIVGPAAIETVPGHGYRFTQDVAVVDVETPDPGNRLHNLPRQLTSLIGRDGDRDRCLDLLATTRLLTITGIGGLGKTRLSLAVAAGLLSNFADGVWFVELAPLSDAGLVPQAVASVLGIAEQPSCPVLETVAGYLANRSVLIILDNCEHLRLACAQVARKLLQAGPKVKLVTSSREPLHVPGEVIFSLSPLSLPDPDHANAFDGLTDSHAARLFVDRATTAHPAFVLSKANAQAVANICTQLDGIPLAIELAAARARVVSVETISRRLNDRFRLLTGGDRTALPRQQTLRATIEWSYDLLTDSERVVLWRLAVFSGGWTLEAAESVCSGDGIEAGDVLDLCGRLIEKSLVVMEPEGIRYRLLETVRQYAQERLDASGEAAAIQTRHLDYFLALAEETEQRLLGPDENPAAEGFEIERENFRSAYAWCDHAETGAEAALRLAAALASWLCRGFFELGSPVLVDDLARPAVQARNSLRCRGLLAASFISYFRGHYDDAQRYGEDGLAIAREIDSPLLQATAMKNLGQACHGLGDLAASRRHLIDGLALARSVADNRILLDALNSLAELRSLDGEFDGAAALYEEALQIARHLGTRHFTTILHLNLAKIALYRKSAGQAATHLRAAMIIFEEIGSDLNAHGLLAFSAGLAALHGDWLRASRFYSASNRQLELLGLRREPADEAALAPLIVQARASSGASGFGQAEAAGRALSREIALAEAHAWVDSLPDPASRN